MLRKIEQLEESQIKQSGCSILVLPAYFLFRCMYITHLSAALPRKNAQFNSMVILTVTGLCDHVSKGKCSCILYVVGVVSVCFRVLHHDVLMITFLHPFDHKLFDKVANYASKLGVVFSTCSLHCSRVEAVLYLFSTCSP